MGHVWVKARICDLRGARCTSVQALIDTRATLSVVPKRLADELGLEPHRVERVQTGAGLVEVKRAAARIEIEGKSTITEVWISDIIDKPLIGATTLELLGLQVDPSTGRLREAPLLLYIIEARSHVLG